MLAVATVMIAASCDSFLNVQPDNRTEIDTEEKVTTLLTSAYPDICFIMVTEMISDNVDDFRVSYTETDRFSDELFAWKDVTEDDNESPENIWQSTYSAIAAANEALQAIESMGCNTTTLQHAKAEALLCRAYGHFLLANLFCMAYDSKTASKNLGIPYITEPEVTLSPQYDRGTLDKTYEMIDKDIQEALQLQGDSYFQVPKYHFNRKAAYAFAARFYLYYEKWGLAEKYASVCLGNQPESLLRDWDVLGALPSTSYSQVVNQFINVNEPANFLLCTAYSAVGLAFGPYTYYTAYSHGAYLSETEDILAGNLWGSGFQAYRFEPRSYINALDRVVFWKIPFLFEYTDPVAGIGYFRTVYPVFWADETLLNRAEARVMAEDYEGAVQDINRWIHNFTTSTKDFTLNEIVRFYNSADYHVWNKPSIKKHLHPGFDIGSEGSVKESLLQCIIGIRRIETQGQGMRWFDIKRYGIEIERRVMNAAGEPQAVSDRLPVDDPRRAIQIPLKVTDANLQANPR